MSRQLTIGVDCRRLRDGPVRSGSERVIDNVVNGMLESDHKNQYVLFVTRGLNYAYPSKKNIRIIKSKIGLLSEADVQFFPQTVKAEGADVFMSVHFYASPLVNVPCVRFIHDLLPLTRKEWSLSKRELVSGYGSESLKGAKALSHRFLDEYSRGAIFPNNEYLKRLATNSNVKDFDFYEVAALAFSLWRAKRIITPSSYTRQEIGAYFPEVLDRVQVVPNFVPPIFHRVHREQLETRRRRKSVLLHVSRWEQRKNLEALLKAVDTLSKELKHEVKLVLVGDLGYRGYASRIKRMVDHSRISDLVVRKGLVSDEQLARIYASADIFVFPSLFEGFGIPVVEAMACGIPVIASNAAALPETCGGAALLVDPHKPDEICEAVKRLLADRRLYSRLTSKGLQRVEALDRERIIHRLLHVIESAAD